MFAATKNVVQKMVHLIERREYNFHRVEIEDTLLYTRWPPTYNDYFYDHTVAFAALTTLTTRSTMYADITALNTHVSQHKFAACTNSA